MKLAQVIVNILSNAIKFTKVGFVKIRAEKIQKNNLRFIKMVIQDSGKGIENIS